MLRHGTVAVGHVLTVAVSDTCISNVRLRTAPVVVSSGFQSHIRAIIIALSVL